MPESRAPSEDEHRHDVSATQVDGARSRVESEFALPRGCQVGRYVVLAQLGAGAMGVVVAAYDPELDRKVALKLLHPREGRRATELAVVAAGRLVYVVGYELARRDDGLRWAQHGELLGSRLSDPSRIYEIQHLNGLSAVHFAAGEFDEVEALQQRILEIQEHLLGPDHPHVANSLNNLANAYYRRGKYDQAKALYDRALAIETVSLGPEHPWVANKLDNIGLVAAAQGRHDEAQGLHERALAIREKTEDRTPSIAATLNNLALVHAAKGANDEAIALHERARAIWEATLGPDHPDVALSLNNEAAVHRAAGHFEQARELYERALTQWERTLGPEHSDLAMPLEGLALIAIEQDRAAEAVPLAERAVRLREAAALGPELVAEARFVLAQVLWEANQDRGSAVEQASKALAEQRERGTAGAEDATEVERWLAQHRP